MQDNKKWIKVVYLIPFEVMLLLAGYSWLEIISSELSATWKHYLTLVMITLNAIFYTIRFKIAVVLTGLILLLAVFNLANFFAVERTSFWTVNLGSNHISTPEIQLISLLLFIVYLVIHFNSLVEWYLDLQEKKRKK